MATAALLSLATIATAQATIERLSVASGGGTPDASSLQARTNGDGSLAVFLSAASNLVADDRNGKVDVFVFDLANRVTERVSLSFLGRDTNDNSFPAVISRDGRLVAFGCAATNVVTGDFNSVPDIFVFDREARTTEIVSLAQNGFGGGAVPDLPPTLNPDGRFVAFASQADDLVPNDDNEASDVFVYDRELDAVETLTYTSIGSPETRTANGPSVGPAISEDGCTVAFFSDAGNLVMMDNNEARDVFVRDRCSGLIERVSVASDGTQANGPSQSELAALSISSDGRFVVFASRATNLDPIDTGGVPSLFVRDRAALSTRLLTRNAAGEPGNAASQAPSISANGRFVAFQSAASNLVADDLNGKTDVFVIDLSDGEIRLVSASSEGQPSGGDSTAPGISDDGARIVFQSTGRLTADDNDNAVDTYSAVNPLQDKPLEVTPTAIATATATPTETTEITVTPTTTAQTLTPTPTQSPGSVTATRTSSVVSSATPTASRTHTGAGGNPTATPTGSSTPQVSTTPGGPTTTPRPSGGGGGGGGCGCRIDPTSGRIAYDSPLPALLLPAAVWALRRRRAKLAVRR